MLEVPYKQIGQILCKVKPEMAAEILKLIKVSVPVYTDLSILPSIFKEFCHLKNIAPEDITGVGKNRSIIIFRDTFIAVAIKLYNPEILTGVSSSQYMKRKLREQLSYVLQCNPHWISQKISTIIFRLDIYDDFKEDVNTAIDYIKSNHSDKVIN